jgi:VWFA-related protein
MDRTKLELGIVATTLLLLSPLTWGQSRPPGGGTKVPESQLQVPNRPLASLFQGQQGKQRTEIYFDPATGFVMIKLLVQDSSGYFIPNIRRENFAVYENGVRQQNATVEIEHASVSLALLMEFGGRYQAFNKTLVEEVSRAGHPLLDVLGRTDKVSVWTYGDTVKQLAAFSQGHDVLDSLFYSLKPPELSEANLYDAMLSMFAFMKPVRGRKAIVLISSGIDTFSHAKLDDVLSAAQAGDTPAYAVGLGPVLKDLATLPPAGGPTSRIDWTRAQDDLQMIAQSSGGRAYSPRNTFDVRATYDDMMENLRVRYVISYKSSTNADAKAPRTIRIELVDPKTGGPLRIVDANGKPIRASVIVQESYVPAAASETQKQ